MLIDSHCHLDYSPLYENLNDVLKRANDVDVQFFLAISTTIKSFEKIKLIIKRYEKVFGTLGVHPHETEKYQNLTEEKLLNYIKGQKKIVGIGETGLDFYYNYSDKKIQKKIFLEHIKAAIKLDKPVIVHSRNAEIDTYDLLKQESSNSNLKILMHCFTGSKEYAKKLLDLGAFISFSGIITFKNSLDLLETANSIPIDRLLIETDSPYLAPVPLRGKSNEPSFIKYTAEKLAHIKKVDINMIKKATSNNFLNLFSLK